jgi:hypothetical protein
MPCFCMYVIAFRIFFLYFLGKIASGTEPVLLLAHTKVHIYALGNIRQRLQFIYTLLVEIFCEWANIFFVQSNEEEG